jgi:hypothetical protein
MAHRRFILVLSLALLPALSLRAADLRAAPTAKGSFSVPSARAGDTVEYRLRVEWRDGPAAIMVLPPRDELKTPGFTVIGQSALHRKTASAGLVRNVSDFSYLLVARDEGQGRVSPFLMRYHDGLSDRVESVPVEGSTLEIGPARVPFLQRWGVRAGAAFLALCLGAGLLLAWTLAAAKRARRTRPAEAVELEDEFTRGVASLKARCEAADSRLWLRDAEKLCVAYLCRGLGVSKVRDVRFEAALDQYLARRPPQNPGEDESWTKLRDLFHEARYAGGRKQPHELREACRHLKICLSPGLRPNDPSSVKLENH